MSETISVVVNAKFKRWRAPNFAVADNGGPDETAMSVRVADLPPAALDAMAWAWLEDLYSKQQRPPPFAHESKVDTPDA